MTKTQRQHRISELIDHDVISTAAQIVARLHEEGIAATQATVTRDLQELGTVKVRDEHGTRRIVLAASPKLAPAPLDHLRRMMGEWVVSVDSSANLVVVRTPPGCAHVVASALDRSALSRGARLGRRRRHDARDRGRRARRERSSPIEFRALAGLSD